MNANSGGRGGGIAKVEIGAAGLLIVSFFLPWFQVSGGYNAGSASFATYLSKVNWTQFPEVDLITFGAVAAVIAAIVGLARPQRGAAIARTTLAGFVAAGIGAVWLLSEWGQQSSSLASSGVQVGQGLGIWLFVGAAAVGALFAVVDLVSPARAPSAAAAAFTVPAPAWTPTHVVPTGGMAAWDAPDPARPPIANLQAGVELTVLAQSGAWAQVRGSNSWSGWVDGRLLVARR